MFQSHRREAKLAFLPLVLGVESRMHTKESVNFRETEGGRERERERDIDGDRERQRDDVSELLMNPRE